MLSSIGSAAVVDASARLQICTLLSHSLKSSVLVVPMAAAIVFQVERRVPDFAAMRGRVSSCWVCRVCKRLYCEASPGLFRTPSRRCCSRRASQRLIALGLALLVIFVARLRSVMGRCLRIGRKGILWSELAHLEREPRIAVAE